MENVNVSWNDKTTNFSLRNINLNFTDGQLYIVAGPVGSGKSSLLKAILNELQPYSGSLRVTRRFISYASQEPWLFNASVQSNVLFGEIYNDAKYARVVDACGLREDFRNLPQGDLTVVGDNGSNLSGGQRARIHLARAVYKEADVYLIDDSLASVDKDVSKHIIDECVNGFLREKLRIVVTHNVHYFKEAAAQIIILNDGEVQFSGSYVDLTTKHSNLLPQPIPPLEKPSTEPAKISVQSSESDVIFINKENAQKYPKEEKERLTNQNECIKKPTSWRYFRAGGSNLTISSLILSLILARVFVVTYDYWLAHWIKQTEINRNLTSPADNYNSTALDLKSSLYIFASLLLASVITWTTSSLLFYKICVNASRNLHQLMFSSLLRAPMRFFELNPSGRILNRFSKDTGLVDETLPTVTLDALHILLMMAGVAIQILIINWYSVFPIVAMALTCWKLQSIYLPTAQALRRAESKAKSPVFTHVQSTTAGLPTIRSSQAQKLVQAEFDALQDAHSSAHYLNIASSSAYGFWLDIVSISLLTFITFSLIVAKDSGIVGGTAGLAISQVLMLYGSVQYGLRQAAEMITQMVGVERIFQFVDLEGEQEKGVFIEKRDWPEQGKIRFDRLVLRYSEDEEPVLKDISLTIEPKEKIGIVGRTGSGKTSLISTLFRLTESEGSIYIDEVDIKTIDLHHLRSSISIVPQSPVIFTVSVRDNLDPFHAHEDKSIWDALEEVGLKHQLISLDCKMENAGGNLSTGQKQLFCFARVILANNKILILDEATASVDYNTDEVVREIVERRFSECTVLTVAHRLSSVGRSDRILTMDQGRIVQIERPNALA